MADISKIALPNGAIYNLRDDSKEGKITGAASGDIASFETDLSEPLVSCKSNINPVQDLHGEEKPYPAGGGTQKFNEVWESGYINGSTGAIVPNLDYKTTDFIKVSPNTQYYCKATIINSDTPNICYYNANKEKVLYQSSVSSIFNNVFNTPNDADIRYMRITITLANISTNNFSINYPSTDHDYHPYANICPINGYTEANITRCGVNLFDKDNASIILSAYINAQTILAGGVMKTVFVKCKPSTTYTVSKISGQRFTVGYTKELPAIGVTVYDENTDNTASHISITTGADAKYIVAFVFNGNVDSGTADEMVASVQIAKGTDTTYHAYNGQTYTIAFGQTVYGGVLDVTRGKLNVTHKKETYNGSEVWATIGTNVYYIAVPSDYQVSQTPKSNMYEGVAPTFYNTLENGKCALSTVLNNLLVHDDNITSLSDWQTALGSNNLEILYELVTPFDIDLTPVQIEALLGVNNVFSDTNGTTEVKFLTGAAKDIKDAVRSSVNINDLANVKITTPVNGNVLVYDSTNSKWINGNIGNSYSTTEQVVGTWMDGRLVYDKTFYVACMANQIPSDLFDGLNIHLIMDMYMMIFEANTFQKSLNIKYNQQTGTLSNTESNRWTAFVYVRYTKNST